MPEDTAIATKVMNYEGLFPKELNIENGKKTTELDCRKKTVRTEEAAIGNLIADVMRSGAGADIGIVNSRRNRAKIIYTPAL